MPRLPRVAELCLSVGLAGLALATVATWLARFGWPFELFAHFTPQLAVAAALIALANLIVGRARWTGMAALLLVANALPWWHRVHDEPVAAACGTPDIRLVSANVAYDNRDHDTFLAWLEANPADGRWPSKMNEFVAVGRPTVACDVGDVANLLRENHIGLLVRPEAGDFAARIDELLADPARAEAMGDRAREVARTTYSQGAIADRLEAYYRNIIATRKARN